MESQIDLTPVEAQLWRTTQQGLDTLQELVDDLKARQARLQARQIRLQNGMIAALADEHGFDPREVTKCVVRGNTLEIATRNGAGPVPAELQEGAPVEAELASADLPKKAKAKRRKARPRK